MFQNGVLLIDFTGNDSFTIKTNGNVNIDREVNPSFDLVIEISDEGGNTGQNVLPIVVIDKNDNPHHPVTKSMLVYAFEGEYYDRNKTGVCQFSLKRSCVLYIYLFLGCGQVFYYFECVKNP